MSVAFERFFTVDSSSDVTEYTKLQHDKFIILYGLFLEKYREQQDKVRFSIMYLIRN